MARAFLFVLDSFGVGGARDAACFGDVGADTYGHVVAACAEGQGDRESLREGPLELPNMEALGLSCAASIANGTAMPVRPAPTGFHGAAEEISSGKDTTSGHWEIAGVPATLDWGYFPHEIPALPADLTRAIVEEGGIPGIIGDRHASGTEIIRELGEEHIATGKPIVYTSTDSVLQIAAHEEHFGLERLYGLCTTVRRLADPHNIGRVIARPFVGENASGFVRTANRRDFSVAPPEPTLLDRLAGRGRRVFGVGKIADIFAHRGITDIRKAHGNMAMFDASLEAMEEAGEGDLVFVNFVDFDTEFGHRRDVPGYAAALEAFDRRLPEAFALLRQGDLLILTGDHGCDPTWRGTDHTRERTPVIGTGPGFRPVSIGLRESFADIAATIAEHLGLDPGRHGLSFHSAIAPDA